jgi:hypothetical protein
VNHDVPLFAKTHLTAIWSIFQGVSQFVNATHFWHNLRFSRGIHRGHHGQSRSPAKSLLADLIDHLCITFENRPISM